MPYNPQVTPQPIRADMSGWGQALLQMLNSRDQQKQLAAAKAEKQAEQAKKEAGEFKTYVAMGKQIGLNPDELTTQDLPTVKGMVEGAITKTNLEKAVQEFQKLKAANASSDALTRAVQAAGTKSATVPQFQIPGQPLGTIMPSMTATTSQPLTSQSLLDAIAKHPQSANEPQTLNLVQALQQGEVATGKGSRDATPRLVELGGNKVIVSDVTGKYDVLPNATDARVNDRLAAIDRSALQRRKTDITKALAAPYLTPDVKEFYAKEMEAINGQLDTSAATKATPEAKPGAATKRYKMVNGKLVLQ